MNKHFPPIISKTLSSLYPPVDNEVVKGTSAFPIWATDFTCVSLSSSALRPSKGLPLKKIVHVEDETKVGNKCPLNLLLSGVVVIDNSRYRVANPLWFVRSIRTPEARIFRRRDFLKAASSRMCSSNNSCTYFYQMGETYVQYVY